jgi:hypothetical protein
LFGTSRSPQAETSIVEPGAFRTNILDRATAGGKAISDYDPVREAVRRTFDKSLGRGGDPLAVARVVLKIARARTPRLRYGAGAGALWIPYIRSILPQRRFDKCAAAEIGMERQPRSDS